jgi:hypothetical protein
MMDIEWSYWVYATINVMLLLTCLLSCGMFAFWSVETRGKPRPELWIILPLTVLTHAAIALIPARWLLARADVSYAVGMILAVNATQSFDSYAATQGLLLIAVVVKLARVWTVRRWSSVLLVSILGSLAMLSVGMTRFHAVQIAVFCSGYPPECEP